MKRKKKQNEVKQAATAEQRLSGEREKHFLAFGRQDDDKGRSLIKLAHLKANETSNNKKA